MWQGVFRQVVSSQVLVKAAKHLRCQSVTVLGRPICCVNREIILGKRRDYWSVLIRNGQPVPAGNVRLRQNILAEVPQGIHVFALGAWRSFALKYGRDNEAKVISP